LIDQKSIAVLPFDNLSSDPENEYFSDGMTEEIINALSKINGLKVTARTSSFVFKSEKKDVRHIGNQLGVSTVLEGSIRKSGERVRITAQLIRTDNGFHIWSENFDRKLEDIFALQDEVSLLIADKIRENFGHLTLDDHLVSAGTKNIEAYNAYLKGRYYQLKWDANGFRKAASCYEESMALDPEYHLPALAASINYAYLSSWNFMPREEARELCVRNLNKAGEEHKKWEVYQFARATKAFWLDWDIPKSNEAISEALRLFPNSTDILELGAEIMTAQGRFREGIDLIDRAMVINPLSPNHHYTKGNIYYLWNKFDQAISTFNEGIAIDPHWVLSIRLKACCYLALKDANGLEAMMDEIADPEIQDYFRILFRLMNQQEVKIDLKPSLDHDYIPWHVYFLLYNRKVNEALEKLNWGVSGRIGQYINFAFDALLTPIQDDERYQKLRNDYILVGQVAGLTDLSTNNTPENEIKKLTDSEIAEHSTQLEKAMKAEKVYLDPALNLRQLATLVDIHPNKLSWLINDQIGKNFNEYINSYRLIDFQQRALDPNNNHLTLLGMAYDSGFNSKSVFNDFFKKQTGQTPKAWVKSQSPS